MRVFHLVSRVCGEHRVRIFLSHHVPPLVGFYSFGLGHNIRDRETTALGLMRFILALRRGVLACATQGLRNLAFMAEEGPDGLARAILLLGGFMMAELGQSIHDVRVAFSAVNPVLIGAVRPPIDDLCRDIARAFAVRMNANVRTRRNRRGPRLAGQQHAVIAAVAADKPAAGIHAERDILHGAR